MPIANQQLNVTYFYRVSEPRTQFSASLPHPHQILGRVLPRSLPHVLVIVTRMSQTNSQPKAGGLLENEGHIHIPTCPLWSLGGHRGAVFARVGPQMVNAHGGSRLGDEMEGRPGALLDYF